MEGRADPEDVVHAEVDASERLLVEQQRGHVVRFDLAVALHSPHCGAITSLRSSRAARDGRVAAAGAAAGAFRRRLRIGG